MSYLTNNLG